MPEPSVTIYLRVPPWLHEAVEEASRANRQNISEYVRNLLMQVHPPKRELTGASK